MNLIGWSVTLTLSRGGFLRCARPSTAPPGQPRWAACTGGQATMGVDEITEELRRKHIETLEVDVRSRANQIHEQRLHYFEDIDPNHLVDQLHSMLCSWYPQTENVDSQKWSKFAKDYELIPGMQDPMRGPGP